MADVSLKRKLRRRRKLTEEMLDDESFNVAEAKGKLSNYFDYTCFDKGSYKLVKVVYDSISKQELEHILQFSDSPFNSNIIIQLWIWRDRERKPAAKPKLFYNRPNQSLPKPLKKFIS